MNILINLVELLLACSVDLMKCFCRFGQLLAKLILSHKNLKLDRILTFNDSEHYQDCNILVSVLHRAREKSSISLLHIFDLQAVIASGELVVRTTYPLAPIF